jgi:phenylacetate-CoA ligase
LELQGHLLHKLICWAHEQSPFYRLRLDEAGIDPHSIRSVNDLKRLQSLEKSDLLQHNKQLQISTLGSEKLFYSETSGSTGNPFVFWRNASWDAWHNASVMRGHQWHGVNPGDRNGYLWGFNKRGWKKLRTRLLDGLQNRFRMFSYDENEILQFVELLRSAVFLGGYSSMIYEVAKRINQHSNIAPLTHLKMVKGTSEKIFERYQHEAEKAFGRRIVSEYGAAEAGIIAFECPAGSLHTNMETCIVEVESGEILVTNLRSYSFPIIRYRLGDCIEYDPNRYCSCGMHHTLIQDVTGRIGKKIHGVSRTFPSLTLYYIFKNLATERKLVLNYQGVQHKVGELRLDIEQSLNEDSRLHLLEECKKYFSGEITIEVRDHVSLLSPDRKKRDFVSSIDD